jgi:hypothetical protein
MSSHLLFKVINIALLVINPLVFFAPKKPMNNVNSNAAGILALIALVIIIVFVIHVLLTCVALYFNKVMLLKVITFIMVPFSLVFWYYAIPMIRF